MATLFGRSYKLTVGTLDLTNLDFSFKITKSLKAEPNTCEIMIWNINEQHRKQLEATPALTVSIYAGYTNATSLLYLGEVRSAHSRIEGPDIITEVSTGTNEKAITKSRINVPIGANTSMTTALNSIAQALGVGNGNISQVASILQGKGIATMYPSGTVLTGNVAQELTNFCKTAQLEWSIQDGVLQVLDLNKPLNAAAVLISANTGMIESPTYEVDKGVVNVKSLLIPDLYPGRKVTIQSTSINGGFRITHVEYKGDTFSTDWYANLTCKSY